MSGFLTILQGALSSVRLWVVVAPWEQGLRVRFGKRAALLQSGFHLPPARELTMDTSVSGRLTQHDYERTGFYRRDLDSDGIDCTSKSDHGETGRIIEMLEQALTRETGGA